MLKLIESRWFKEGQAAQSSGKTVEQCPYGVGSPKALLWVAGFESVAPAVYNISVGKIETLKVGEPQ